jgi:hypothetical protein
MWLKAFTTVCLIAGFGLLVCWPMLVGTPPTARSPRAEILAYRDRTTAYMLALTGSFVGSGIGALLVVRQVRAEYRRAATANMRDMVDAMERERNKRRDG